MTLLMRSSSGEIAMENKSLIEVRSWFLGVHVKPMNC